MGPINKVRKFRFSGTRCVFSCLLAVALNAPLPSIAEVKSLPNLGNSARSVYSEQEEQKLGRDVMVQIRQSRSFIDDPELTGYIQSLGQRLTRHVNHREYGFFLVNDPSINAFALPGGYIGINSGLIMAARDESELAAVLAHEIIHVDQQHFSRMMAARKERSGLTAAALLASMVLAGTGNQQAGEAGVAIATATNLSQELSYSRDFEREADRLGIQLLAQSGFRADAMAGFFERLQQNNRLMGGSGPEYLRTHPIETNRIAEARDRARKLEKSPKNDQHSFLFTKARLIALYTPDSAVAESRLQTDIGKLSADARDYGLAILLDRTNRSQAALALVGKLRKKRPNDIRLQLLEADIHLKNSNKNKGLALYSAAYRAAGGRKDVMQRYAIALINYREFEQAYQLLAKTRSTPPQYPEIEKLYAQAAGETGRLVEAHRAMAEYYYIQGDTSAALQQLQIARNHAKGNQYFLSSIDARKNEMEQNQ